MHRAGTGLLAAGAGLAAVVLLTGCSLAPNKELRALLRASTPPGHEEIQCSWGSTYGYDDQPSANYGCFYFVKGGHARVIGAIRARLTAGRFTVSARRSPHVTALIGLQGRRGICAQVVEQGFVLAPADDDVTMWAPYARVLSRSDETPSGYTFVDLSAYKLGANELMPAGTACDSPA